MCSCLVHITWHAHVVCLYMSCYLTSTITSVCCNLELELVSAFQKYLQFSSDSGPSRRLHNKPYTSQCLPFNLLFTHCHSHILSLPYMQNRQFNYDHVLQPTCTQLQVYAIAAKPLVQGRCSYAMGGDSLPWEDPIMYLLCVLWIPWGMMLSGLLIKGVSSKSSYALVSIHPGP